MRIFQNTTYDIIGQRKIGYIVSIALLVIGLLSIMVRGLQYGIDFKGGTEIQLQFSEAVEIQSVRQTLQTIGITGEIKRFGSERDVLVRTEVTGDPLLIGETIKSAVSGQMSGITVDIVRSDENGPKIAQDMKQGAFFAIIGILLIVLIYITLRFELKFAVAAIVATLHDVLVVLGIFSLMYGWFEGLNLEIDQAIIASFLTIVGYSLNDTVVVFDRIREYRKTFKGDTMEQVMNKSINSTLSRTIMVSFTTLIVMLVLFLFGGESTRGFSFAMIIGIFVGTFSSIFVASPLVLEWENRVIARFNKERA